MSASQGQPVNPETGAKQGNTASPRRGLGWPLLAILAASVAAYLPITPWLGLYWDDWPSLWFLHLYGPGVFPLAFSIDRPVQGWLFVLTTGLLGESMLAWQVFGILARWLSGAALLGLLFSLWPERREPAVWVAALYVVYPGFIQQLIPITYSHQFLILSAFLAALALMVQAVRRPRRYWLLTAISASISTLSYFALEYFFGLALLRPALIWIAAKHPSPPTPPPVGEGSQRAPLPSGEGPGVRARALLTLRLWLPYLLADSLFLFWRVTHTTPRGQIMIFDQLRAAPLQALLDLAVKIAQDLLQAGLLAWTGALHWLNTPAAKLALQAGYWATLVGAALLTGALLYFGALDRSSAPAQPRPGANPLRSRRGLAMAALGLYGMLIAGWPVWVTNLRLDLEFPWDRFTLLLMLGACLLLVGLLDWLVPSRVVKISVVALLVGLAAGAQYQEALRLRQEWQAQRAFFWQMATRIPGLQPGTAILAPGLPFGRVTDNSLTAPLNWMYAGDRPGELIPDENGGAGAYAMDYLLVDLSARLGSRILALEPGQTIVESYRATRFEGSTSQALVLFYEPPRCLRVLDPVKDRSLPNRPDGVTPALPLSRPELIDVQAEVPTAFLERFFGSQPAPDWCSYFLQADLAVQAGDYARAAALGEKALAAPVHQALKPRLSRTSASELAPFIEAYAHTGQWQRALELSQEAARLSEKMPYMLCDLWRALEVQAPESPEKGPAVSQAFQAFACSTP